MHFHLTPAQPVRYRPVRVAVLVALMSAGNAIADYRADIGHTSLQAQLGTALPTGQGVSVSMVEAATNKPSETVPPVYRPNPSGPEFAGKTIDPVSGTGATDFSSHATSVARLFFGNLSSIAPGITAIRAYDANDWLGSLFDETTHQATAANSRVVNHSWVGSGDSTTSTGFLLRVIDRQTVLNQVIQIAAMNNGSTDQPLASNAYNVISVGRTDGNHSQGTMSIDSAYVTGRTKPDLVVPRGTASEAAPVVSAAAALLVQVGHQAGSALSEGSVTVDGVGTVYNAERADVIRAILMAGAARESLNTSTSADIVDYGSGSHRTANGLDDRFGAGQLDVAASYQIVAAGEQNSAEDGTAGGVIAADGFDYDDGFGGTGGRNSVAHYHFTAGANGTFTASLVWNLNVSNDDQLTTELHHLSLSLFDVTTQAAVGESDSILDNTQNIWASVFAGHQYEMRVAAIGSQQFSGDYALAWRSGPPSSAPVPLPGAVWLFGSALLGTGLYTHRRGAKFMA